MRKSNSSRTAKLIAESICFLSGEEKFQSLVPAESAKLFQLFSQKDKIPSSRYKKSVFDSLRNYLINAAIPGITLHYLLRKKRIEEFVRQAIAEEFQQIVILGAGFDTLGLRLGSEFNGVKFIEIDRFENQLRKIRALNQNRISFPNLSFIAGDLENQTLCKILSSTLFDPKIKTFFIAEGLLMYLSETKVRDVFHSISDVCHSKPRFAFTSMNKKANGKIRFDNSSAIVDFWLDLHSEPFKWGISRENTAAFLAELGYALKNLETDEHFRQLYLNPSNLHNEMIARGEFLCLAEAR